ncbi:MAG TPA: hypothetical protein VIJ86_08770 [Acidimicrobiales bacterium]
MESVWTLVFSRAIFQPTQLSGSIARRATRRVRVKIRFFVVRQALGVATAQNRCVVS